MRWAGGVCVGRRGVVEGVIATKTRQEVVEGGERFPWHVGWVKDPSLRVCESAVIKVELCVQRRECGGGGGIHAAGFEGVALVHGWWE